MTARGGEPGIHIHHEARVSYIAELYITGMDTSQERIFRRAFQIAEVANLNPQDMERYELSLKDKRDWESAIETAVEEGREKGIKEGIEKGIQEGREKGMREGVREGVREVARNLKRTGMDMALIAQATGLTPEEIEKL